MRAQTNLRHGTPSPARLFPYCARPLIEYCAQRIHDTRQIEALSATVETKTKETDALRQLAHSLAAKLKQAEATVAADAAPPVAWSLEAAVESVEPEAERQKKKKKNAKKPKADLRESAPFGDDGEAAAAHAGASRACPFRRVSMLSMV
jgi:hypothetical protein